MILHYLKIAWRNVLKYKTQSIISILGLTIGVVFFAYGYHWYKFETTYDSFYPNSERIYSLYGIRKSSNKIESDGFLPQIAAETLKKAFPEIESMSQQLSNFASRMKYNDIDLKYPEARFYDEHFFRMFPQTVVAGEIDLASIKMDQNIFITESYAKKVFEVPDSAIGKVIISGYDRSYTVQAVVKDPPPNSIFKSEVFIKDNWFVDSWRKVDEEIQWRDFRDVKPYILLHPKTDLDKFTEKLRTFAIDHGYHDDLLFEITPLSEVRYVNPYFFEEIWFELYYIRTFIFAGALLLLVVLFNYLNILIKSAIARVQEINLRRVAGASVKEIFIQLFIEVTVMMLLVTFLSLFLIEISANAFEKLFKTTVTSPEVYKTALISIISLVVILFFLLYATLYRFIRRTSFIKHFTGKKELIYNKSILVLQLMISLFFIMSAFLFYQQISFMKHADKGISVDHILQVEMGVNQRTEFMEHIYKLSMVEEVIESDYFTIIDNIDNSAMKVTDVEWSKREVNQNPVFQIFGAGENFFDSFELNIIDGGIFKTEDFTMRGGRQANKVVINQIAANILDFDNPIGEKVVIPANIYSATEGRLKEEFEIIGVVKDFHALGFQSKIPPLFIKGYKAKYEGAVNYVKVAPGTEQEAIKAIQEITPKFDPYDENKEIVKTMSSIFDDLLKKEQELLKLFFILSLLCILIAVFGIFSMSQRETQRRQKEIAIRKTAGAKTKEIMNLFFKEYLSITMIASALGLPLAWIFMNRWLQSFAYHISISWWMFVVVIVLVTAIVLLTIFYQIYKASNQNPATVIKGE